MTAAATSSLTALASGEAGFATRADLLASVCYSEGSASSVIACCRALSNVSLATQS